MPAPPTRRGPDGDTLYGVDVPDPFRWLEDPDSDETREWVAAQNVYASRWLDVDARTRIRARLEAAVDHERQSPPAVVAGARWCLHNPGLAAQAVLMRQLPGHDPEVALDPNLLSTDGTRALSSWAVSPDGQRIAYAISDGGSDWMSWRVRDVATGEDLPDRVDHAKFVAAKWLPDSSGFVYLWYPQEVGSTDANHTPQVRIHVLGTPASADRCLASTPDEPEQSIWPELTDDGAWLILHLNRGSAQGQRIRAQRMDGPEPVGAPIWLVETDDDRCFFIGNHHRELFFLTDADAPRQRVVATDMEEAPGVWRTVVPESEHVLAMAQLSAGRLFCTRIHDCTHRVTVSTRAGQVVGEVPAPPLSSLGGFVGDAGATELFFSSRGWTRPPTIHRYDVATGEITVHATSTVPGIDLESLQVRQIFVESRDGTRVPAFQLWKGDDEPRGPRPTVLYGYGGFNIPLLPEFSASVATWLDLGGAWVVGNLRGGGEYGKEWHDAGTRLTKQNTFDDAIAIAEHLVATGFTEPSKLGIHGRSNGGLLAGEVLVQRPDLFAAAVPSVGVLDLLRYHTFTIGWAWARDYGTVDDSEEMFRTLLALSPVHNARPAEYPATLITTGDHDDRVVPAHSYKFAAALQAAQQGDAPILLRIDVRGGHGAGKPVQMAIDEWADMWTFLAWALGLDV